MTRLLQLCRELDRRHVTYQIVTVRPEALMLSVAIPGWRWEIEFFTDGSIEVERFQSLGVEDGSTAPEDLLALLEPDEPSHA